MYYIEVIYLRNEQQNATIRCDGSFVDSYLIRILVRLSSSCFEYYVVFAKLNWILYIGYSVHHISHGQK